MLQDVNRTNTQLGENPHIAVVIPARNEEDYLEKTMEGVLREGYHPLSLIVVDSASTDNTSHLALQRTPHVVRTEKKGVARARNAGARKALEMKVDIIVFVDADTILGPGLLKRISHAVSRQKKIAGTCKISLDKHHWRARLTAFILNFLQRFHRSPHSLMFCISKVAREIPFEEKMVMAEDERWAYQVMQKYGWRKYILITDAHVVTSSRRFEKYGYWNILYKWWTNLPFSLPDKEKEDHYFE